MPARAHALLSARFSESLHQALRRAGFMPEICQPLLPGPMEAPQQGCMLPMPREGAGGAAPDPILG
eukprot:1308978-Lingulodinium_polyedra.AAC.1